MKKWRVPLTIVEYGREALIEAATKAEALEKFRRREWDYLTDADDTQTKVTKRGPCIEDGPGESGA